MKPGKRQDPIDQWLKFLCLHIWTKGETPYPVLVPAGEGEAVSAANEAKHG